jgi:uncharacterized protein (TIGR02246 family)
MPDDTQAIRDLIGAWMTATREGDLEAILDLMSEDVVFLQANQPVMRGRAAFATGFKAGLERFRIDAASDIQEIEISGAMAFCWNHLTVAITPHSGEPPTTRSGDVLSVLRKESDGRWRLFRDANLLA